tara:strand:+ start:483 stop:1274 length:792 start_codon:yes stop_codon:yes gene_type:complete
MEQNDTVAAPNTASAPGAEHLVDITATETAPVETVPSAAEIENGALSEDRPEWLPEKFKTAEDLAKSYSELEKKITNKVPEKYDWSMTKDFGLEDVTPEMDAEISQVFKKAGFSQDQVKTAIALYSDQIVKMQSQLQSAPVVDIQAEAGSLKKVWGTEYTDRLDTVRKFATTLPERVLQMPLIDTAEGIQFLESLMESGKMPNPITNKRAAPMQDVNTVREEIRNMRMDEKFKLPPGDPVGEIHRQKLYSVYEQLDRLEKNGR